MIRKGFFVIGWLLAMQFPLSCQSPTVSTSSIHLVGGQIAQNDQFASVLIWTTNDVALHDSYCTGTKVGPDLILTAAHCVLLQEPLDGEVYLGPWRKTPTLASGALLQYTFTRDLINYQPEHLELVEVLLPPVVESCIDDPDQDFGLCQFRTLIPDLALIRVRPHGTFRDRPVAPMNFEVVGPGDLVQVMGYGAEGENSYDPPRLKYAPVRVATAEELAIALSFTFATRDGFPRWESFYGVLRASEQEVNLGSGDSGGPVFDAAGEFVVGVNSDGYCFLENRDCQLTNNSIFGRIDIMADHDAADWLRGLVDHLKK